MLSSGVILLGPRGLYVTPRDCRGLCLQPCTALPRAQQLWAAHLSWGAAAGARVALLCTEGRAPSVQRRSSLGELSFCSVRAAALYCLLRASGTCVPTRCLPALPSSLLWLWSSSSDAGSLSCCGQRSGHPEHTVATRWLCGGCRHSSARMAARRTAPSLQPSPSASSPPQWERAPFLQQEMLTFGPTQSWGQRMCRVLLCSEDDEVSRWWQILVPWSLRRERQYLVGWGLWGPF